MKIQMAILGEIKPTTCECHKGQFINSIYLSQPGKKPTYITNSVFKTEKEAEAAMPEMLKIAGDELVKMSGLPSDNIKVERLSAEQATAIAEKFELAENITVH